MSKLTKSKRLEILVDGLRSIRQYPKPGQQPRRTEDGYPLEVIYDEFAYKRMVDSYRAGIGLLLDDAGFADEDYGLVDGGE